jgi:sensor histidine kinase YesM
MKSRSVARAYLLSIAIWCSLSVLTGWEFLNFDKSINIHSSLLQMMMWAEARGIAYALLTPPIFYFIKHYESTWKHKVRYAAGLFLGLPPFMLLYACIHWIVVPPWDPALQRFVPRAGHHPLDLISTGFADQITIYVAIVVAAHAYVYFERSRKLEVEGYEYRQALATSELQALKMQIHPHFLFNTLHGISTLIDEDPTSAKRMIIKLSGLLRTALGRSGSDLIPLRDELKFIEEYLDLERMRLGPRLEVYLSIDPDTQQLLVPQLILQPLVENAIRHGIARSQEKGWIIIETQRNNGVFSVRIQNSGAGKALAPVGMGVGLRNTEARLKHLYSEQASFSFWVDRDGTATTKIVVPALGIDLRIADSDMRDELHNEEQRPCGS